MSKVIVHSRKSKGRKHEHLTLSKTGYIPTGTNYIIDIKIAKKQ